MSVFFGHFFERIKSNREIQICGIKENHIFLPLFRYVFEYVVDEITVWDSDVPRGSPPIKVVSATRGGARVVHDADAYDRLLARGK